MKCKDKSEQSDEIQKLKKHVDTTIEDKREKTRNNARLTKFCDT